MDVRGWIRCAKVKYQWWCGRMINQATENHTVGLIAKDTAADFTDDLYIPVPVVSGRLLETLWLLKPGCILEHMNRRAICCHGWVAKEQKIHFPLLAQDRILEMFFNVSDKTEEDIFNINVIALFCNQRYFACARFTHTYTIQYSTRGCVRICIWK